MRTLLVLLVLSSVAVAKPKREPLTVVIAIDRSMDKSTVATAKQAALATAASMDPGDQIAVIGYDSDAEVDVPLQSAGNRQEIADQIDLLESTNVPASVSVALVKAKATLSGVTSTKHVIIITASNAGDPRDGAGKFVWKLRDDGATITTVGLRGADRNVLSSIADRGNGRSYVLDEVRALPKVCVTELKQVVALRLPTSAAKKREPAALAIVVDRSGSMQGAKLDAAKQAITITVAALDPDDIVSVVAFDSEPTVYVRPQRAANRTRIGAEVSRLLPGGATNVWPGLKDAFEILRDVNVKARHVILLSDGNLLSDGIAGLVADIRRANITISTVALSVADDDEKLLEQIAMDAGGQLYKIDDLKNLSATFVKDMQQALLR